MAGEKWSAGKIVGAVYVTEGKRGPRFSYFSRGRLWPLCREAAEASFAAGATVYRKQPGTSVWAEQPVVIEEGVG
jgi:hypothetical protein